MTKADSGLYFAVEAADERISNLLGIQSSTTQGFFTSSHYANAANRSNPGSGAIMRASLPANANISAAMTSDSYYSTQKNFFEDLKLQLTDISKNNPKAKNALEVLDFLSDKNVNLERSC